MKQVTTQNLKLRSKKSLGQNFLIDGSVIPTIIKAADISAGDVVIEVGPGKGILTEALLDAGAKVFAIEKDFDLIAGLTQKFGDNKNIKIIHQDALFFDLNGFSSSLRGGSPTKQSDSQSHPEQSERILDRHAPTDGARDDNRAQYKVVSNLPFNIASPLIRKFLESENQPALMVVMVQKEVAEKIAAKPGNRERGILTLSVEFYGQAEIITTVPKTFFSPQPKVDAAVMKIRPYQPHFRSAVDMVEPKLFFRIVKAGFSAKRRQIHNSLAATLRIPKDEVLSILQKSNIDPENRAEDLSLDDWLNLCKIFQSSQ